MPNVVATSVGLMFNPAVPKVLEIRPEAVDYLAVVPDTLQVDQGAKRRSTSSAFGAERFVAIEALVDVVDALRQGWPMVAHGVGLSIGSPGRLDQAYVDRMRWWVERYELRWFSEHLSFFRLPRNSTSAHDAGLAAPLPFDRSVLRDVARKAKTVQDRLGVPFLLENGVSYLEPQQDDLDEPAFLAELARTSGTGLLLDLHNLYTNARNHGFDAGDFLDQLAVQHVVEVHVAGGEMFCGMYTDAHSGAVPEQVWSLLERLLPRAPNLRAVAFEFHESRMPRLGVEGVVEQLSRAREVLNRSARLENLDAKENQHDVGRISA